MVIFSHPAVAEDVRERDSVLLLHPEAGRDQVPAGPGDLSAELQLTTADLLVLLEGDVATDHIEEEDPQGPDSGAVSMVLVEPDPLRRGVDSGPFNVSSMLDCLDYNVRSRAYHRNLCRAPLPL